MSKSYFSSAATLIRPGLADGYYPERTQSSSGFFHKMLHSFAGIMKTINQSQRKITHTLAEIHSHGQLLERLDDTGLKEKTRDIHTRLHREGLTEDLTRQAFALVREIAGRTINMRHYDSQLIGGWIMIHGGIAEMETGEGKTFTATLTAATAALAGIPVHIITVNDYLADRDAQLMAPIYKTLGLAVGTVTSNMTTAARRAGYSCNITYCTNKQLAFDYLRDRILLGNDHGRLRLQLKQLYSENSKTKRLFLRGLCFAIVDEADSVLIDEARTPLVISRKKDNHNEEQTYLEAVELAKKLLRGDDFSIDVAARRVQLSDAGSEHLAEMTKHDEGIWNGIRRGEELICLALTALYLHHRDRHYLVQNGKVLIIDENTGRVMADRFWERGLHQMIEIKENCEITWQREHIARLTYQRFFRRYLRLAGMTGTGKEVRRELWSVYHLSVVKVPTNKPVRRKEVGQVIFSSKTDKWETVVRHVRSIQQQGRPVLIGTRSVVDSDHLSRLLDEAGLAHQVLNARQDAQEAEVISRAGENGVITVATNMAGRGTDIPLGNGVARIGGLHIIATERNEAQRIDRQLFGRCGRQGDPGSYEKILSFDDELFQHHLSNGLQTFLFYTLSHNKAAAQFMGLLAMRFAQFALERRYQRMRSDLLQSDEQLDKLLAFSGRLE